jgi:UDP-3-O-[3-hydroxymyristoyl] N-acetylglucosamine deacetylase
LINKKSQIYKQKTLKKSVSLEGIGLFTGQQTAIELCPVNENSGITFQRVDLTDQPLIPASLESVKGTSRCTLIGNNKVTIQTVEHLLSALGAYQIDNLLIKVKGPEIPAIDGSSDGFVELIEKAGVAPINSNKEIHSIKSPFFWSEKEVYIIALPADEYRISYTLHYPHSSFLRAQYFSCPITSQKYKKEIAPSRTFSLYEEIEPLLQKSLIKGGGLNNAVIIKEEKIMNPEGVRFPEEMARHKVLDLIGDLSLIGIPFLAHIVAIRSGHYSNISFAKKFLEHITKEICS